MAKRQQGFPTLKDLKAKVPQGGLLNPNLRKGFGKMNWEKLLKSVTKRRR